MHITNKLAILLVFFSFGISSNLCAQEDTSSIELNIYPNPNNGRFYITLINEERVMSQLFSMDGKLIKTTYLSNGLNYMDIQAPAGIYVLKVGKREAPEEFKVVIR